MFSLESPHRGDSIENAQHNIINIKKRKSLLIISDILMSAMGFFFSEGTKE